MWLRILIVGATLCLSYSQILYPLFCVQFYAAEGRVNKTEFFVMEAYEAYEEVCYITYTYRKKDCSPVRMVGGIAYKDEVFPKPRDDLGRSTYFCTYSICSLDLEINTNAYEKRGFESAGSLCLLNAVRVSESLWGSEFYKQADIYRNMDLEELTRRSKFNEQREQSYMQKTRCIFAFLTVDEMLRSTAIYHKIEWASGCVLLFTFNTHGCKADSLLLGFTNQEVDHAFHRDRNNDDIVRFDYSCDSSPFCNHNLSILTDVLKQRVVEEISEKKKQNARCALNAAEQLVDQYSERLLLAYQEHMAKPQEERRREEKEAIPRHEIELKDEPRVIIPLIDRFQRVDPELLRLSDELKEMRDKSQMWIQMSIFCFYFSVISFCLIREFIRYRRRIAF